MFSNTLSMAAPCTTCTSFLSEKSASSALHSVPPSTMPSSSITYIKATTRGRESSEARSVASARPVVCVVCSPVPTSRKASPAHRWPTQAMPSCPSPVSTSSAKGMIASPPNCSPVPIQM